MEYAYYGILFSLKMEEILSNVAPWMNLEDIMLSELSQSEKDKIVCSYLHELPGGIILIETESRMVIAKGWGWVGNGELLFNHFPGDSDVKNLQYRRPGFDPWVRKIPWRRERLSTPLLVPGVFCGQKSLSGYSPWGRKESDMSN